MLKDHKLPDCMMPDGGHPCIGYTQLLEEYEKLKRKIDSHNSECEETCNLWRDTKTCPMTGYDRQCSECPKDWIIE